jgi:biopolymer transport protein ExbD
LLIIFFAVAGKFTDSAEQDVPVPQIELGEQAETRNIRMVVTKGGRFLINGSHISNPDELTDNLKTYITEGMSIDQRTVVIYADRDAEYGDVATAVEAVDQADAYLELAVRPSK